MLEPDHPLYERAATLYPVSGDLLVQLKKKRHLGRLLEVLEGRKDPSTVGLDDPVKGYPLPVAWSDMEAWLRDHWPSGARWNPYLFERRLVNIRRKKGPACYWLAHDLLFTLAEATSALLDLLYQTGREVDPPPFSKKMPYLSGKNTEQARARVFQPRQFEGACTILTQEGHGSPAARAALGLLVYLGHCVAGWTLHEEDPVAIGFVVVPRELEDAPG